MKKINHTEANEKIYVTSDYSLFKHLDGNRTVTEKRVAAIMDSVETVGQKKVPILVNSAMQVIDGQGRLEVFKRLGLPVYYTIDPDATIGDCIAMNVNMKRWNLDDYILCYADSDNPCREAFKTLIDIIGVFGKDFPIHLIHAVMTKTPGNANKAIKSGNLHIDRPISEIYEILNYLKEYKPVFKSCTSYYWAVLNVAIKHKIVDRDELLKKVMTYREMIFPVHNKKAAIDVLSSVFNKRRRDKVDLWTEYANRDWSAKGGANMTDKKREQFRNAKAQAHSSGVLNI